MGLRNAKMLYSFIFLYDSKTTLNRNVEMFESTVVVSTTIVEEGLFDNDKVRVGHEGR